MSRRKQPAAPVQSVTSAPQSRQDDQGRRMRQYLLSMGIRTICFVLAVLFIAVLEWSVLGWICAVAAAVLPYFAVLLANATGATGTRGQVVAPRRELPGPPAPPDQR